MKTMQNNEYIIDGELDGIRLDKAVSILENEISRARLQKLIDEEKIMVNR